MVEGKDSEEPNVADKNSDSVNVKEETCNSDSIESIICAVFEVFYVKVKCNDKELYLYCNDDLKALLNDGRYIEVLEIFKRCEGKKLYSVYDNAENNGFTELVSECDNGVANIDYDNERDDEYSSAELEEQNDVEDYAILNEDACNYYDDERDDDFNECDNEDVCNYYDDERDDDLNECDNEEACNYYDDERDDDSNECDNEDVFNYYDDERDDDFNECDNEDACNYYDDERDDDFNESDNEDACNYYDDERDDDFNECDNEDVFNYYDEERDDDSDECYNEDACDYYDDERDDDSNECDNEDVFNYYDDERDDDFNECDNEDVCNYYDEERDDVEFTESDDEDYNNYDDEYYNDNHDEYYNDYYDEYYNDYERDYSYSDAESEPNDFEQYDADEYLEILDDCDELDSSDDGDRNSFFSDSKLATHKYYLDIFVKYLLSKNPDRKQKALSVNPAISHDDELIAYHLGKVNDSDVNIALVSSNAGAHQKVIKNKKARYCQNFIELFKSAVKGLMLDYSLNENTIKLALEDMKESYRNVQDGKIQTEIDFNDLNYTVGYLKRFALCHAAMVQKVILNILQAPPRELSYKLVRNQKLNLVCLGSGPGNDLVGFLSAFHGHLMKLRDLDITVVDRMAGWQVAFSRIIQLLKNESHGNLSILFREGPNVTTSFIAEDLKTDVLCVDLKLKLHGADMILLVKSLSHVPNEHKLQFLKNIVICMKSGTLLFYIDCPFPTATFSAMSSLRSLYNTETQRYSFKGFGRQNISSCQASTHIFVKEN